MWELKVLAEKLESMRDVQRERDFHASDGRKETL